MIGAAAGEPHMREAASSRNNVVHSELVLRERETATHDSRLLQVLGGEGFMGPCIAAAATCNAKELALGA